MIDTSEYYGGKYPEPHEVIDEDDDWLGIDDFDSYMSDINHEEMMLRED